MHRFVSANDHRPQRLVFGSVAEAYDRFRPTYPDALFDHLLAPDPQDVLDIGSGTGKVAATLLARGIVAGHAIEPDPDMAEVARARLAEGSWSVHEGDFESCPLPREEEAFDLITCGQAWHWIDAERGLARARRLLRPGGRLALFWNRPVWADGALRAAVDEVYARLVPDMVSSMANQSHGHKGVAPPVDPAPDGFADARNDEFANPVTYTAATWTGLLGTHSNHVLLDDATRATLQSEVARVIDEHGGSVQIDYRTDCWSARRL